MGAVEPSQRPLPGAGTPVEVDGTICDREHLNHPLALRCAVCGEPVLSGRTVRGPRPAVGVLLFDDGSTYALDGDYLVGRDPSDDPTLVDADGRSFMRVLEIADAPSVSRVHAEIRLRGWEVYVVDRGSANGTFMTVGAAPWERLAPGRAQLVPPDARVTFGRVGAVFQRLQPFDIAG